MSIAAGPTMPALMALIEACRQRTSSMVSAAEAGDWERVAQLEELRWQELAGLDVEALPASAADAVLPAMRQLVALDGQLMELAAGERQGRLAELRRLRGQSRGSAAYRQFAYSH